MANTYTLISSVTVPSGGASTIDFTSIPSTYTDLSLRFSHRSDRTSIADSMQIAFNGNTSNMQGRYLEGNGTNIGVGSSTTFYGAYQGNTAAANIFGNWEMYLPNYANTSTYKSFQIDNVVENNVQTAYQDLVSGVWQQTVAINRITLTAPTLNWLQYSTAYLYGISKS